MVARILLRVVYIRFQRLPFRNTSYMHTEKHTTILPTLLEIVIGILCVRFPRLFVNRARHTSHFDVEKNASTPSSAPLFTIGVCACLVLAIALSASVTLISVPGLDSNVWIGGLIARSRSVVSMATSFRPVCPSMAKVGRRMWNEVSV